jgi:hypothetical protein
MLSIKSPAIGQSAGVYDIQSAYLYKITSFIEWPKKSMDPGKDTFVIGIAGHGPINYILKRDYKDRKIKNKEVAIEEVIALEDIKKCDLLYINRSEEAHVNEIMEMANRQGVLAFAYMEGFGEQGGHVNFYIENNKVRFEINHGALKNVGFSVGSLLLDYARIVETKK